MNYNKYNARKVYSKLCNRTFDSKAEAKHGEELYLREKAGDIKNLQFQVSYLLCQKPNIKIKVDFVYQENGKTVHEDVKGYQETREFRVNRAWLKEKTGIDVVLII